MSHISVLQRVINNESLQTKAFNDGIYVDLCKSAYDINKRVRLLNNIIVNRRDYAKIVVQVWKSSVIYKESLKCPDVLIFLLNVCAADNECIIMLDWDLIFVTQISNPFVFDVCNKLVELEPDLLSSLSNVELIYELCHDASIALAIIPHLQRIPQSPRLLDLLDLLVFDHSIVSMPILKLASKILISTHQPASRLCEPSRVPSPIEVKKPLLLNLIASLMEDVIIKSLPINEGYNLLAVLLECCQYDQNIPFTREPAVLAISRLTRIQEYNDFILNMQLKSVHPSVEESLSKIGFKVVKNGNKISFNKQINAS
eukprot:NODE_317_length_11122_cov_0.359521.p4 type:complete len:314 gc:universal NODE_317_length_11122_cov_0.359521:2324-1383(-)